AYENTGQGPGYDVTITDTLPEYTTYEGCETPVGTCSLEGDQVVFNLGTVEPNTRGVVTLTVRLDDAFPVGTTDVVNRAVISNSLPGDDPANNTAEDVTQVQAEASLCVRKDDNPDPVEAGEVLTYTINWRINGNAFVNDTTITDTLDANVTFVSASHGGVYVPDAHAVRWDLGTRYPEPQPALTLVVRVKERVLNEAVLVNRVRIEVSDPGVAPARDLETTTVHSSYLPGSIGDTVWHDVNGDGVRDAGEPGIGGVTVDLYVDVNMNGIIDAEDKMVGRETTDENGHYLFENLITDHYLVTVSDIHGALAGMTKTSGTVGEDNNSQPDPYPVHLGNGESNLTADFGYTTGGMGGGTAVSIGDLVWRDGNGNGVYEPDAGEVGIPGVTLKLIRDLNGNGVIDPGEPVFGTVTTDADGHYLFTDLPPDTYIVDVTDENHVLTFYTLTTNNDPAAVDVSDGQDDLDVDFGYRPTGTGKIGDLVFYDANNDGVQQSGESGLANVEVELYGPGPDGTCGTDDDVLLARTWTDADGHYMFEGLPAGTYCVKVVESTLPEDFLVLGDHFTNPHGPITLPDGGTYLDADFGYTAAMVEGVVFDDTNGNGVQDEGEQGIGGASVCLYEKGSTTPVKCVTTDDNGYYQFPMLPPGEYQVQLTSWPRGYEPTTPVQVDVVAPAGGVGKVDFGLTQPSLALTKTFDVPPGTPVKVEVGDVVTFTIRVENTGGVALSQIGLEDTFDPTYLRFLRADPMPNSTMPEGTLTWDDLAGGGSMAPGEVYTVRVVFEALAETDATTNTATVRGVRSAGGQTLPDISDDVTFSIQAPTAVTMADILAEFDESGAVVLTWITTAEFDNWGFNVYRAEVNDPSQAVRINDTLIPGRGQSVIGATYRYVDETVERGKTYWYWIEDVELGGRTTWHGPVEVYVPDVLEPGTGGSRVFMPMVLR
ncbi:MAG: DUF11 domain-containing protein, partial [Chloroflexi bacterium]|nr:DUF11 domain-containing protein [Chloroflexota bacterium]